MDSGESGAYSGGIGAVIATQLRIDAIDAYRNKWFAPENQPRSSNPLTYGDIIAAIHSLPRYGMSTSGHWTPGPELTRNLATRRYIRRRNRLRRRYARWLVDRAREFATAFHASIGQRRKYTDEPYNRLRRKAVRTILRALSPHGNITPRSK